MCVKSVLYVQIYVCKGKLTLKNFLCSQESIKKCGCGKPSKIPSFCCHINNIYSATVTATATDVCDGSFASVAGIYHQLLFS